MNETTQSDGWRQDAQVSIETVCRVRYNRLEDYLLKTIHPTLLADEGLKGSKEYSLLQEKLSDLSKILDKCEGSIH
ncbi:MAG: hypothetical protein ACKVH8_09030 [Pirellulales bacterium]